ncbi:hypothetical protein [Rossellomorea marisflavi]|uniref:hypothetical protein n=1 Tax=Rossellomorea marisflavi TaxID=189381 RepID=UPI00345A4E48
MKMSKIVIALTSIILLYVLSVWFFPFSYLSVYKNIAIKPDSVSSEEYRKDLEQVTSDDKNDNASKKAVIDRHVEFLSQKQFTSSEKLNVNKNDLVDLRMSVNKNKMHLIELVLNTNLTSSEKEFLTNLVEDDEKIESEIDSIMETPFYTRSELKNSIKGIHEVIRNQIHSLEELAHP